MEEFPSLLERIENDPDDFFRDSAKRIDKSLLLFYLNSGYAMFDQYKEYDANSHDKPIDKEKIIEDIRNEQLSDDELHAKIEAFYARHSYSDANLYGCGTCGFRIREKIDSPQIVYKRMYLKDSMSKIVQYNKDDLFLLEVAQEATPLQIPIDEKFNTRDVHTWKIRSVYESQEEGTFHLHPELVDIDQRTGNEYTLLCPKCWESIHDGKKPEFSIANGLDFGYYKHIGLEPPNLDEQMILVRCRLIIATLKICSNSLGRVGCHRDKLLCHAILFAHNAATKASALLNGKEMLNVSKLKDMLKIYFLDPNGNIDHLFHSAMKRNDIFACPWVICQWLWVLHREHNHYGDIEVPDVDYIREKIDAANEEIQQGATHVTSESAFALETQIGSDVA